MFVYRIERQKYLHATLTGIGASLSSANRWNGLHTRMVYTAESRSLALLEIWVHLDLSEDLPQDRLFVQIEIPDDIEILELSIENLPNHWDIKPPNERTQKIGDLFILQNQAAVLKVPSAIIPYEYNFLINPFHQDAHKITVKDSQKLVFDERLKWPPNA